MIFDIKLAKRAECSSKEKKACVALITTLIGFSEKARREGILALEDDLTDLDEPFLVTGLQLVVDGTDPEVIKEMLYNTMVFSGAKGEALLRQCIIMEGVLSIQAGDNPRIVLSRLAALLGKYGSNVEKNYFKKMQKQKQKAYKEYVSSCETAFPYSENTRILDDIIPLLSEQAVMKILREVDTYDLSRALVGAGGPTQKKVFDSCSKRAGIIIKDEMTMRQAFVSEESIIASQNTILSIIQKLEDMGEIIVPRND